MIESELQSAVMRASTQAMAYAQQVRVGKMTDARAVIATMRVAALLAGNDRKAFVRIVANTLVNLANWPHEVQKLRDKVVAPVGHIGRFFVPFQNSGFCRNLRDNRQSDVGNLPHHMLSYYVMASYHFLDLYVLGGVVLHEVDTYINQGRNPEGPGDIRSGHLGVSLARQTNYPVSTIPDLFLANAVLPHCGHPACKQ